MRTRAKERIALTSEEVVYQYFKCIDTRDLSGTLDLFDYDAVVHEPFSNITGGLKGRSSIEPFLKVAMMANSSLQRTIKFEKPSGKVNSNKITALITFEKGDRVKGRFTFEFENGTVGPKKIKSLNIEFL
ncbi:MAG TPA: nuclear transport factor 2 family protein [Nitrososphaera sp.]|nr:nuclear transport factor 2 family protein [Nitrososphaera sp.]